MFFNSISVNRRLLVGFGIMILLVAILGYFSVRYMKQLSGATVKLYRHPYAVSTAVLRIEGNVLKIQMSRKDVTLAKNRAGIDAAIKRMNEAEKLIFEDLDVLYNCFLGDKAMIDEMKDLFTTWKPSREKVFALLVEGKTAEAEAMTQRSFVSKINQAIHGFEMFAQGKADEFFTNAQKASRSALTIIYIIIGVSVLIGILLAMAVSASIIKPLKTIVNFAKKVAGGDLKAKVEGNFKAEFGDAQEAITKMVANLREGQAEVEKNVRDLNKILSEVSTISNNVADGSAQVSDSSQALSQGATEQAASLQEITSSMTELGSQTTTNAENASQANQISSGARDAAENGNQQMQNMISAMSEISNSSKEIAKIIKAIDDIAFQTNLLALNAAVEAARAGKHGKGFAVVAQEVRNLAGRSAKAAQETADLIEGSVKNVDNGTEIVNRTAAALGEIVQGVTKVSDLVAEIAAASNEQAQGIAQVNQGLNQVEQVTQQNTANAEQTASASEELSSQARQLRQVASGFNLSQDATAKHAKPKVERADAPKKPPQQPVSPGGLWGDKDNDKDRVVKPEETIALDDGEFGKY